MIRRTGPRLLRLFAAAWLAIGFAGIGARVLADCSSFGLPFTDLDGTAFCAQIAEAYYSGLANGTSSTTFAPTADVPREQMAAFVTRTLDQSLARGSRRGALDQWWTSTPHYASLGTTTVGTQPEIPKSDGADIWVSNFMSGTVSRVRASDGRLLQTWTGATKAYGVLVAMGKIFVDAFQTTGTLYEIDPSAASGGAVTTLTTGLGHFPAGIAFDGDKIWTANSNDGAGGGSVSIVTPGTWAVTNVTTGFREPVALVLDGTNMWVTDATLSGTKLLKLDSGGAILQTVDLGQGTSFVTFDGHNIWAPNLFDNTVSVVRASDGAVLKTLSGGLDEPGGIAFDGQRVLVVNESADNNMPSVTVYRATDLTSLGKFALPSGSEPLGACSDGVNFWIALQTSNKLGRF